MRFGFGMLFLLPYLKSILNVQVFQRHPAIVAWMLRLAIAARFIAVCAANRADSFAGFAANPLHRELQQHLLPQYIFQLEAGQLIKSHFGLAFVDGDFFFSGVAFERPVKQIEWRVDVKRRAAETTVALGFEIGLDAALNTNLAARVRQQFRHAFGDQRTRSG